MNPPYSESIPMKFSARKAKSRHSRYCQTRGKAFEAALAEEGVQSVPFDAGFFASIASDDPDAVSMELEKEGIFTVPLAKGVRVSVASISKEKCVKAAKAIARVVKG